MKRGVIALAVVVALLVGAGAIGLPVVEGQLSQAIKSRIETRGNGTVAKVETGVLGRRIVLNDVTLGQLGEFTLKAAKVEVSGLSWPLSDFFKGFTPFTGWRWGEPLYAERVEVTDLHLVNAQKGEVRVARIVIEGFDLPRYHPHQDEPPDSIAQAALAFSHLSVRRFEQQGLAFQVGSGDDVGIKLAGLVIDGLDKAQMKSFGLRGIELREKANRPQPWIGVAEFSVRNLDLRGPVEKLKDVEWVFGMPTGRLWAEQVMINGVAGEALSKHGVSVGSISAETKRDGKRATGRTKIEDFAIRPQGFNREALQTMLFLTSLGLREVKASFECSGGEDREKGEFEIDRCVLTGPDLAEIQMTMKIVNGDEDFWNALDDGELFGLAASKAGLGNLKIVVRDNSLLDRLVGLYATTSRMTKPQARAALAREVRRFQPTGMLITEDMTKLADTIAKFVEQGGTLTLEAKPDPPLTAEGAQALDRPGPDIVSLLGLSATLSK